MTYLPVHLDWYRIVQRHRGRFEMPYKMTNICGILESEGFQTVKAVLNNVLGVSHQIINQSLLLSCPGTDTQSWHQDGPHLVAAQHLDCHCLNMYSALATDVHLTYSLALYRSSICRVN